MRRPKLAKGWLFWCGAVLMDLAIGRPLSAQAPKPDLAEWLRRNAREVRLENGRLAGAGADWLFERAARAQFVFVGEEHGVAEIPKLAAALWRGLVPLGYRHIALEEGPWVVGLADRYVKLGDTVSLARYLAAVAPDLPPGSLEHRQFLDSVRRTPGGRREGMTLLWGLDQEMRPAPILRRLAALSPTSAARALVERAARKADSASSRVIIGYGAEIAELRRAFGNRSAEARWLLDLLEQSNRIYENNDAARDSLRGYESNREREDMMKDLFLARYREAQRAGERRPRVMLQFGSYHGMRGMSPTHVFTLGNFLADLARAETGGSDAFFNVTVTCGRGGTRSGVRDEVGKTLPCGADEAEWAKPMLEAAAGAWTVFDLRPLRAAIHAGVLTVPEPMSSFAFAYDALVTIAGTTPMHFPLDHGPRGRTGEASASSRRRSTGHRDGSPI